MSAIINAIFGTYPEPDKQAASTNQITVEGSNATTTERLTTSAVADDVHIKSVISTETQAHATVNNKLNIDSLLSQLNTTHAQVDQYSRERTAEINDQVQNSITDVLTNTQRRQEELIVDANRRHLIIDNEYKTQLQKAVEALDVVKAKTLADLERDLQAKQHVIMADAKRQIDALNDQANAAKLHALVEAQEQAKQNISNLADQVAVLGQQETQHLLESKTTTIITSQAQASGKTEAVIVVKPVTETSVTTVTNQNTEVAVRGSTDIVAADQATAFGTVTGASDLTTKAASTHSKTKGKGHKDNTTF